MESSSEACELIRKFLTESHVTPDNAQVLEIKNLILSGDLTFQTLVKQIKEQHELHQIEKQKTSPITTDLESDQKEDVKQEKTKLRHDLKTMFPQKEETIVKETENVRFLKDDLPLAINSFFKRQNNTGEENEDEICEESQTNGDGGLFDEMTAEKLLKTDSDVIKASVSYLKKRLPIFASEVLETDIESYFKPVTFSEVISEYEKVIEKARDQIEKSLSRNALMPTIVCSVLKISFFNLGIDKKIIGQFFSEFFKVVSQRFYIMYSKIISKHPDIQIKQ